MTKLRPPLTIDAALTRAADLLPGGWLSLAELTGRGVSLVRAWGDPDRREAIPLAAALQIDQACRAASGETPFTSWLHGQLNLEGVAAPFDPADLVARIAEVVRETGEANAALVEATRPGASAADIAAAQRETEQAVAVLLRTLPLLRAQSP